MMPAALIEEAQADGLTLTLTPAGTRKVIGDGDAVHRPRRLRGPRGHHGI